MSMIIYDNLGNLLLDIEVDDTSYRYKAIKGENSLTLKFSLAEHIEVPIGSYCSFKGEVYSLMLPEDLVMNHRRSFDYTLVMHSDEAKAKRYMFINPVDGRLKFSLTAKPREHLQMFVDNMNRRDAGWSVGECPDHVEIVLSYNHTYCHDALVQLANDLELDYWFDGKTVNLGKLEVNKTNPLPLSYGGDGEGLRPNIKRSNYSESLPIEVLYVQGGTANIDASSYGASELHMPENYTIAFDGAHFEGEDGFDSSNARVYVTDSKGYSVRRSDKGVVNHSEDSLDCSEIEPTKEEVVVSVIEVDEEKHFYDITFSSDVDYSQYGIDGEVATIVFQSGMLAGKEFDLATDEDGNLICKSEGDYWRMEIVPQEIDGITMPDMNSGYSPVGGDTFKVFGIQLPEEYIWEAELEMLKYAVKHLYTNEDVQYTISGELDEIYAKKNWGAISDRFTLGNYISFSDKSFQEEPLLIRIIGVKEYVNKPYSPILEISNAAVTGSLIGTLNRMENEEARVDEQFKESRRFTKRSFARVQETLSMIEAAVEGFDPGINPVVLQTMAIGVGSQALQFAFIRSLEDDTIDTPTFAFDEVAGVFSAPESFLMHYTIDVNSISTSYDSGAYRKWQINASESEALLDGSIAYYLYAQVRKSDTTGDFILTESPMTFDDAELGYYNLLVGVLNTEYDGFRSFVPLYGFTEVLPGQITTDVIRSADGQTYFDLVNGVISGKIRFEAGSSGLEALDEWASKQEAIENAQATADEALEKAGDYSALTEYVDQVKADLQSQIDGAIDSYFYGYKPTTSNYPASEWDTDEEKESHLNDTFTNLSDGRSWRWSRAAGTYSWVEIADTATSEALRIAGEAQAAADGKRTVFQDTPTPPYQKGDLWAGGDDAPLKMCIKAKLKGESFDEDDWALADNAQSYADAIIAGLEVGGQNLLRNSGFTGDYLSEQLADEAVLDAAAELYSSPLDHWTYTNTTIADSTESISGKEAYLVSGRLSQILAYKIVSNESYVVSFKAKGISMTVVVGNLNRTVTLTEDWQEYEEVFTPSASVTSFVIANATCTLCDLQLEKGNRATSWSPSQLDNASDRAYWQSMKYLQQSIAEGSTTFGGGLVLTNHIKVGNYANQEMIKETAGMNGTWTSDDDVAFWAGGTLEQAISTMMKYVDDPTYEATEEEIASMAKFVVTHGGRGIFNDAIIRGTVYAQNGVFGGRLQLKFQRVQNEHTLAMTDSSSMWLEGSMEDAVLYLPEDDAFDGWMLNVFAYPVISKGDGEPYVRGRILCPHKTEADSIYHASQIYLPNGGHLEFTYNTIKHEWVLLNDQSNGAEYTRYEE